MELKLLVIRTAQPAQVADFYRLLGFVFVYHQHGTSPYHYSAVLGKGILEIYPLANSQTMPDQHLRLGFQLDDFDATLEKLQANNITFVSPPQQTPFGLMAVVADPDGRKVELYP